MSTTTETRPAGADGFDVPQGREEAWRFTPLKRLRGLHESLDGAVGPQVDAHVPAAARWEIVPTSTLSLSDAALERTSALVRDAVAEAGVLTIPAGTSLDEPCVVRVVGRGAGATAAGVLVVEVQAGSRATVVVEHAGSTTFAGNVELHVGDGASLTFVSVQEWENDTVHAGRIHAVLGRDARLRSFIATLGGDLVRLVPTVEYAGPGGDAELLGLFFADAGQHFEHRLSVDHSQPHCRSNVVYRGALQGQGARTVWIGDVLIRAAAIGTDTYEINRNLVLTDGARADSVPNLEIETGEIVGAGHASATGRFDDEQLFYLQSRGIPADEARRLVVRGFFGELLGRIEVAQVRDRLLAAVEAELGGGDPRFRFDDEGES